MTRPTSTASHLTGDLWHQFRRWNFEHFRAKKFRNLQKKRGPFDTHQCIFVHIPKCAGISVVRSLFGNFDCGHTSLSRYQIMFGPEDFNRYFKFTFVRNPFDRLVSAYLFMKKGGLNRKDKRWSDKHFARYDDFGSFVKGWVNRWNIERALHFRPQARFICLGGKPRVDFIGHFENLTADFAHVAQKLQVQASLQEINRNAVREKDYRQYYTAETRAIVEKVYAEDFKLLGYTF
jgi:hypothetical protein